MKKIYFIDFETGGLKSYVNGVCTATIKELYKEPINFIFYPQKRVYEYSAFQVNGLDLDTLYSTGESREKIIKHIGALHEADNSKQNYIIFVGWNIMFDMEFLNNIYKEKNKMLPCPILAIDLCEIARKNIKKKDNRKKDDHGVDDYKLTTIYQHLFDDYNEDYAHTAEYDVLMCENLYLKFQKEKWI